MNLLLLSLVMENAFDEPENESNDLDIVVEDTNEIIRLVS